MKDIIILSISLILAGGFFVIAFSITDNSIIKPIAHLRELTNVSQTIENKTHSRITLRKGGYNDSSFLEYRAWFTGTNSNLNFCEGVNLNCQRNDDNILINIQNSGIIKK